jgi:Glycosyl hydrolase family 9
VTTGYHAPCHLDDSVRVENGEFLDLVGGWHDARDLLKWSDATLSGMIGLLHVVERSQNAQLKARIFEEVKWGNLYFLKLQNPEGYYLSLAKTR